MQNLVQDLDRPHLAGKKSLSLEETQQAKDTMIQVSNEFLNFTKDNFPATIFERTNGLIAAFQAEYKEKKRSTLQLDGLSSRARIYLLMRVIEEKRKYLPVQVKLSQDKKNKNNFDHLCTQDSIFDKQLWKPEYNQEYKCFIVIDQIPTIFSIDGDLKYSLTLRSTFRQPGNGIISFCQEERATSLSYNNINAKFDQINLPAQEIWQKILKQKKHGDTIEAITLEDKTLLNGYSVLLDFEVARRKVEGDQFKDLPLITCFPFIMKVYAKSGSSFKDIHNKCLTSLFEGQAREKGVENLIRELSQHIPNSARTMRKWLKDFHHTDEVSEAISSLESQPLSPPITPLFMNMNSQEL